MLEDNNSVELCRNNTKLIIINLEQQNARKNLFGLSDPEFTWDCAPSWFAAASKTCILGKTQILMGSLVSAHVRKLCLGFLETCFILSLMLLQSMVAAEIIAQTELASEKVGTHDAIKFARM